jgi:hypothetical protein
MYCVFKRFAVAGWAAPLLAVVFALPTSAYADELPVDQQIQVIRSQTEAQRQATMAANVIMTDAEGEKFWPIYRDYRTEMAKLGDERIAVMKDLADHFESLTDAKAKSLTDRWLANEKERIALKAKYVAKYQKVLSAVKAARVLQIENKLDALVDVGLASSIPLVSPPSS